MEYVLPDSETLSSARNSIYKQLPSVGITEAAARTHLKQHIQPGLSRSSQSSRYYGFVTGGTTPVSRYADNVVTEMDQNVQVHLPHETIATDVEYHALNMLCELFQFGPADWKHKTFTTGATASNVVALGLARDWVVAEAGRRAGQSVSISEMGFWSAMKASRLDDLQILCTVPHSSIRKAAAIVGMGREAVKDLGCREDRTRFDHELLKQALGKPYTASIIVVSSSEVNTGHFATNGIEEMVELRRLAEQYGAWIHVDAAFGIMCRVLPPGQGFDALRNGVAGMELADSITGDAHKLLNVVGFFRRPCIGLS